MTIVYVVTLVLMALMGAYYLGFRAAFRAIKKALDAEQVQQAMRATQREDDHATHCPGCDCFDDEDEMEAYPAGMGFSGEFFSGGPYVPTGPACSKCGARVGLPHFPRCTRRGIVVIETGEDDHA